MRRPFDKLWVNGSEYYKFNSIPRSKYADQMPKYPQIAHKSEKSERPRILTNHVCGLLCNHDRGPIGVAAHELGHDRGIDDTQVL
jgi:hypothetical protein